MKIVLCGISHKTAPIDIRERFYLTETERELFLSTLHAEPSVIEAFVLSTCNRTEVYAYMLDGAGDNTLTDALFRSKRMEQDNSAKRHFYSHEGEEAVEHLLRVSAGLDSLVLGERQILGQVKTAVELARKRGTMGKYLNILSALAVKAGKKAQAETQISYGGVSVSWAAVTTARSRLGTFHNKSFLIIGAGKMAHLAAGHLSNRGAGQIYVMNRSHEKAEQLAVRFGGRPVSYWDMKDILGQVDVCIVSAGAPHYLLDKDVVQKVMACRACRALLCVDISIPRNIDPAVASVQGVSLITVDDLGSVVAENMEKRYSAISQVESIISGKVDQYYRKMTKVRECEETGAYEATLRPAEGDFISVLTKDQ